MSKENIICCGSRSLSQVYPSRSSELRVIGAGLMRTGTTSLKQAFENLLHEPCYHMSTVACDAQAPAIRKWINIFDLYNSPETEKKKLAIVMMQNIYHGFGAAIDYPTCVFYKELMDCFPSAKVILSIRNPEEWVASCRATMLADAMLSRPTPGRKLAHWLNNTHGLLTLHDAMFTQTLGANFASFSDSDLKQAYERWNQSVIEYVPKERLLIYNTGDGWSPLCNLLNLSSDMSIEFPHLNRRPQMQQVLQKQIRHGQLLNQLLCLFALIVCSFIGVVLSLPILFS